MRRRIRSIIVAISLTLAFVTAALWFRSHHTADTWRWSGSKGQLREVALAPGQIRFATAPWCGTDFEHLTSYDHNRDVIFSRRWSSSGETVLGIGFDQYTESILLGGFQGARPTGPEIDRSRDLTVRVLTIRFPLLLLVFSVAPFYFVAARLLARRVRAGFCPGCGYDMRATPGRCPECGTVPEPSHNPPNAPDRAGGIVPVGRARRGAGPAGDRPYVMQAEARELRKAFAAFLGDERFTKFVAAGWRGGRLRYWQEQEWRRFCAARPDVKASLDDLEVALRICELHGDELRPDEVELFHGCLDYAHGHRKRDSSEICRCSHHNSELSRYSCPRAVPLFLSKMQCPRCSVTLDVSHRQGVETDVCPRCRGVWLDRGELDKIIDRYQAWDDDDDREHRPARYPKRKTFWSELFD